MWRPSKYDISQDSLIRFADKFNEASDEIKCIPNPNETYDNDGYFCFSGSGDIGFDWEIRDKYFENGRFLFNTLGQYERKLSKPSIQLSVQCDRNESAILVAWHSDFLQEQQDLVLADTDSTRKQLCPVRYTAYFQVYTYQELNRFRDMLKQAILSHQFSHLAFGGPS